MPRVAIDYSKTIIYKICCKDVNITDIYVGHTTDLKSRKRNHKNDCHNLNGVKYNYYVYQFIRKNGGWDNFDMIVIEEYQCENRQQALIRERYWFETLHATLNKFVPLKNNQEREEEKNYHKKYYEENKEKYKKYYKEYSKEYYKKNIEKNREKNRKYREKNKIF